MVVCYFETGHVDALAYALRCDTDALTNDFYCTVRTAKCVGG